MFKKIAITTNLIACLASFSLANAADICMEVKTENTAADISPIGQLEIADCKDIWTTLKASHKFPGIFWQTPPKLLDLCYVSSPESIRAKLGSTDVLVTSKSAWTSDLIPNPAGGDFLANIISEWTIRNSINNSVIGKIYSMETLDVVNAKELSVIISGSGKLSGAKGSIRIHSTPLEIDPLTQTVTLLEINHLSGNLCIPK